METRKVQLSGGTTYTVSLPKSWAREHGIDAGSVLSLHPNGDGSLLVETTAERDRTDRTAELDVTTDSDTTIRRRVRAAHAVGFDSITLVDTTGHPDGRRELVEQTVAELSGFELLESSTHRIEIHDLIDARNVDVRKSTLRLRLIMLSMHRDALSAVVEGDEDLARRVVERDAEADKLLAMITRHFRRSLTDLQEVEKLGQDRHSLFEYFYAARQFERVADHAEKIATFALDPEADIPEECTADLVEVAEAARGVVDDAADAVLRDSGVEPANDALDERDRLLRRVDELDRSLYDLELPGEAYVVGLLLDSVRRTAEYGGNLATVAIQRATRAQAD